jgi:hypothetical protein
MERKSKKITSLLQQVEFTNNEIDLVKNSKNKLCSIVFYNGSGEKNELAIFADTRDLINTFNEKQKQFFEKIKKEIEDAV